MKALYSFLRMRECIQKIEHFIVRATPDEPPPESAVGAGEAPTIPLPDHLENLTPKEFIVRELEIH